MSNETKVVTPKFTACFPAIFKPKEFNGKEKYQLTMVFNKSEDLSKIKDLVKEVAIENFGGTKGVELPFKDGNKKDLDKYPVFENTIFIQASTQFPVGIVDRDKQEILDEREFYAGCIARAQISAYSWKFQGRKGISFNLNFVQKLDEGNKLGGSSSVDDIFDSLSSTKKSDDDLGFDID